MDLAQVDGGTTPFLTFDACDGEQAQRVLSALDAFKRGNEKKWTSLVNSNAALGRRLTDQGIEQPSRRSEIPWDDPTLLFISCVKLTPEGRPIPIGEPQIRERIGRFPWGDGSALNYMLEFIRPNHKKKSSSSVGGVVEIKELLNELMHGCGIERQGNDRYSKGKAGMDIRGFIDAQQVRALRMALSGRAWSVSAEEPIDGGMRDVSRNLIAILRAAERRDVGLFLRSHA